MRILNVGDLHLPATRKGYLQFCMDIYEAWDCDTVVFAGDVVDWHAISFHAKNPHLPGPTDEYELACVGVRRWAEAFPEAYVCIGNHDKRPSRLAKTVNIPDFMLKDYNEIWPADGWIWDYSFKLDDINFRHGKGCRGIHPAWNLMNKTQQSCSIGHCHTRAGIKWFSNDTTRKFGMDVGCGVDAKMWQFVYQEDNPVRPFLSCGVVIDGIPHLEPMPCGIGEGYHDSRF